jgi:threonyl-tRNA synthetase
LDFQMPQRFDLEYVSNDGSRKTPIVIHRALLGSFERFMGILIEQYAGALPLWLAPEQVVVVPISDNQISYAQSVMAELKGNMPDLRISIDDRSESMGKKIREALTRKACYIVVVGDKEMEAKQIAVRGRNNLDLGAIPVAEFSERLHDEISNRKS